jgi:PAS domain S-box-containing protein
VERWHALDAGVGELERLVDLSIDLLCVTTMSGRLLAVNPAWSLTLGWDENELRGRKGIDFVHPDDRERTLAQCAQLARRGTELHDLETRMLHRDGSSRWLSWGIRADGDRLYGVAHDITARREAEAAARDAVELVRVAFEDAPVGMAVWNLVDFRPIEVNRALCTLLGRPARELLDTPPHDVMHPGDRGVGRDRALAMLRGETDSCSLERRLIAADGRVIPAKLRLSIARNAAGEPRYGICQVQDLTEERSGERALRASEERYRAIVETTNEGVWMIDADHRTTYVNRRMAEMLGYAVDEMLGRPVADFALNEVAIGGKRRVVVFRRKDGSELRGLLSGRPLTDSQGGYGGALAMISEKR